MKILSNYKRFSLLTLILICSIILFSCSSPSMKDESPTSNPSSKIAPTPTNLLIEATPKGVFLRWDDMSYGRYNVRYQINIAINNTTHIVNNELTEDSKMSLPILEISDYLFDEPLHLSFGIISLESSSRFSNQYTENSLTSNILVYDYDPDILHLKTSDIPTNLKIDNQVLSWDTINIVKYYELDVTAYNGSIGYKKTIKHTTDSNEFDLSYLLKDYTKLIIRIKSLGYESNEVDSSFYHDSFYSDTITYIISDN